MPQNREVEVATEPKYRTTVRFALESLEGLVLLPLLMVAWPIAKHVLGNWQSTPEERTRAWPGDDLAPAATHTYTRAIDVSAPAEVVWRWVIQFGLGRAGFYSYELFERLVGIPVRNVESILLEHQSLNVGEEVKLHPDAPGIPVGLVVPGHHICFGESGETTVRTPDPRRSWSIYVLPVAPGSTRLVVRSCIEKLRAPTLKKRLGVALDTPLDFTMEQRMLRTVRRLSEEHVE
jgi:hypothetical protein